MIQGIFKESKRLSDKNDIFNIGKKILSLFLIMLMGIILIKTGMLSQKESKGFSVITMYLINPCMILYAFRVSYTKEILYGLLTACLASVIIHVLLIAFITAVGKLMKLDAVEKTSMIYSSGANLIIPIVSSMFGNEWVILHRQHVRLHRCLCFIEKTRIMQVPLIS